MKCSHCGQEHPDGFQFCPVTGKQISLLKACSNEKCINFGKYVLPPDAKFCPECGRPVHSSSFCAYLENGHEYVDLGLSVKWATCNVGARRPEEFGDYFAWGETRPKNEYQPSNLKYCNEWLDYEHFSFSKYNSCESGLIDYKEQLELNDDVAHIGWGGAWRMPTEEEFIELSEKCDWEWYFEGDPEFNGIAGYKVTSKSSSRVKNSIFLPAAGIFRGKSNEDKYVNYWSSSIDPDVSWAAMKLSNNDPCTNYWKARLLFEDRFAGCTVRPVFR